LGLEGVLAGSQFAVDLGQFLGVAAGALEPLSNAVHGVAQQESPCAQNNDQQEPLTEVNCNWHRNRAVDLGIIHAQRGEHAQQTKNERSTTAQEQGCDGDDHEIGRSGGVAYAIEGVYLDCDHHQQEERAHRARSAHITAACEKQQDQERHRCCYAEQQAEHGVDCVRGHYDCDWSEHQIAREQDEQDGIEQARGTRLFFVLKDRRSQQPSNPVKHSHLPP